MVTGPHRHTALSSEHLASPARPGPCREPACDTARASETGFCRGCQRTWAWEGGGAPHAHAVTRQTLSGQPPRGSTLQCAHWATVPQALLAPGFWAAQAGHRECPQARCLHVCKLNRFSGRKRALCSEPDGERLGEKGLPSLPARSSGPAGARRGSPVPGTAAEGVGT